MHLHCHTEHSALDGLSKVDAMVDAAAADNQPAIALTDHGSLGGFIELHDACKAKNVKPIYGIEAYFVPDIKTKRDTKDLTRHHITLLARSARGYSDLIKMATQSQLQGFYGRPLIDYQSLNEFGGDLIATTGCMASVVNRAVLDGDMGGAEKHLNRMKDIFGDRLYIERQWNGIPDQDRADQGLLNLQSAQGLEYVVTNDCHYVHQGDAHIHDCLLSQQTGAKLTDQKRFRFSSATNWVRTEAEMREAPYLWIDRAMETSVDIASRVESFSIGLDEGWHIPDGGRDTAVWCRRIHDRCMSRLASLDRCSGDYVSRLDYEMREIERQDALEYFGLVARLCDFAKSNGIVTGPGRGSAAGSLVAYCLGITKVDPIEYGLLFERFMNPGRKGLPDIDLDFDHAYRPLLIEYLQATYGESRVAIIGTNMLMGSRKSLRAACKVHGRSDLEKSLSEAIPEAEAGKSASLQACLDEEMAAAEGDRGKRFYAQSETLRALNIGFTDDWREDSPGSPLVPYDSQAGDVVATAVGLEGILFTVSNHAGGVVVAPFDIDDIAPLRRNPDGGAPITVWTMDQIERLGLLKIDVLGLKTLESIGYTVAEAGIDIDQIPLDDSDVFRLLSSGDTATLFQVSGEGITDVLRKSTIKSVEDIASVLALYRPGPMSAGAHMKWARRSSGKEFVVDLHPLIGDSIPASNLGCIIYQEDVMRIAQDVAGYTLAEADDLRKAAGKKIDHLMAEHEDRFINGDNPHGHSRHDLASLWAMIKPFADYGFNKSHAICYALICYQTAYLKWHYPAEWFAANLKAYSSNREKVSGLFSDIRHDNRVAIRPPGVKSRGETYGREGVVHMGISSLKGSSQEIPDWEPPEADLDTRLLDFIAHCRLSGVRAQTVKALAAVGGLDDVIGAPCAAAVQQIYEGTKLNNCLNRGKTVARKAGEETNKQHFISAWDHQKHPIEWGEYSQIEEASSQLSLMGITVHDISDVLCSIPRWAKLSTATIEQFVSDSGYLNSLPVAIESWEDWKAKSGKNKGKIFRSISGQTPWGQEVQANLSPSHIAEIGEISPLDIVVISGFPSDNDGVGLDMWARKVVLRRVIENENV